MLTLKVFPSRDRKANIMNGKNALTCVVLQVVAAATQMPSALRAVRDAIVCSLNAITSSLYAALLNSLVFAQTTANAELDIPSPSGSGRLQGSAPVVLSSVLGCVRCPTILHPAHLLSALMSFKIATLLLQADGDAQHMLSLAGRVQDLQERTRCRCKREGALRRFLAFVCCGVIRWRVATPAVPACGGR